MYCTRRHRHHVGHHPRCHAGHLWWDAMVSRRSPPIPPSPLVVQPQARPVATRTPHRARRPSLEEARHPQAAPARWESPTPRHTNGARFSAAGGRRAKPLTHCTRGWGGGPPRPRHGPTPWTRPHPGAPLPARTTPRGPVAPPPDRHQHMPRRQRGRRGGHPPDRHPCGALCRSCRSGRRSVRRCPLDKSCRQRGGRG